MDHAPPALTLRPRWPLFPAVQQSLFPDNTYRHDSGGDPQQIPGLTYQEFQEFHAKYYHPTNARCAVAPCAVSGTDAELGRGRCRAGMHGCGACSALGGPKHSS